MGGGGLDEYKPAMVMFALQFTYAGLALITRAALVQGMSPPVFIFYRQAIATLVVAPISYISRRKYSNGCSMGLRSFSLIFLSSLIGVTINQNVYFEGIYLSSSSMASAMGNLVPAVTFVIATITRLESLDLKRLRSVAKIIGTSICVSGAVSMALLRGPKLLNSFFAREAYQNWLLGCQFLFASCCCWSLWLILQVPCSASYPDHLSQSAWMCFFATIQSAIVALFLERDPRAWNMHSNLQIFCCLYAGIIGSGVSVFLQTWCVSRRGPLFTAMFNPLCTVIVTILAALFLHEEIYTGSLLGAVGVIIGLYVVLWGKAKDIVEAKEEASKPQNDDQSKQEGHEEEYLRITSCRIDLEEPLLYSHSSNSILPAA